MPNIEMLDVLMINYNTIDTKTSNRQIIRKQKEGWCCANKAQDTEAQIDTSNSKLNYFLLGLNQEANRRASAKLTM